MDRYDGLELVATGGMAEVWRGFDTRLRRAVAIKLLDERYADDAGFRARLMREARTAAAIGSHPNVVMIFDVGESGGRPFIVMQYAPGGSVADRVARGRLPVDQCLRWLDQAADALDHAHHEGIVHRDVKPANLLLDAADDVLVADFGIARAADPAITQLTHAGEVLGTPGYIAPEQAEGGDVSSASDRYALGAVAFELLTGRRPFQRTTTMAELVAHVHTPVPSVRELDDALPAELDAVFRRALAKDPDARFASAAQFVHALRRALDRADEAGADVAAIASYEQEPTVALAPAVRTRPRLGSAAAVLLLLFAVAGIAALLLARQAEPERVADPAPAVQAREPRNDGATRADEPRADPEPAVQPEPDAPDPEPAAPPTLSVAEATRLNDDAWALMQQGRYEDAVPLLERALPALEGAGLPEAYASYNLGKSLLETGHCSRVRELLMRSQSLQRPRQEIAAALAEHEARCGRA